jgi:hypothetical protein
MKIKITLEAEVTMGGTRLGTGFMGYMPTGTTYKDLVRVFGKPNIDASPDGKVKAEWLGRLNGLDFTIYDYKSPVAPEECCEWHIGGRNAMIAPLVIAYFKTVLGDK